MLIAARWPVKRQGVSGLGKGNGRPESRQLAHVLVQDALELLVLLFHFVTPGEHDIATAARHNPGALRPTHQLYIVEVVIVTIISKLLAYGYLLPRALLQRVFVSGSGCFAVVHFYDVETVLLYWVNFALLGHSEPVGE